MDTPVNNPTRAATTGTHAEEPDLRGRVVVLTGATGAIGRATTTLLSEQGAIIAALGRNPDRLTELDRIPHTHTWPIDLRDQERLHHVSTDIRARLGAPAILLTFAGGNGHPVPTTHDTLHHWNQVIYDDLTSTYATIHTFLPDLLTHPNASIVTMASTAGLRATKANAAYAAAKAGIIGLTRHLAAELAPHHIRVNCIAPSTIDNDRLTALPPPQREHLTRTHPLGRIGTPIDVAHAAIHLAGPHSTYTSGTTLELGGPPR